MTNFVQYVCQLTNLLDEKGQKKRPSVFTNKPRTE